MFYLTLAITAVGLVLYIASYVMRQEEHTKVEDEEGSSRSLQQSEGQSSKVALLHKVSKYLLKEVLMTFLIFSMFNLSFSAGLQMKYISEVDPWSILAMMVVFTLIIVLVVAQWFTDQLEFGEYLDKFKPDALPNKYITFTILYRFTLGLLIALLNEWQQSGIIFLLLGLLFLGYIFHSQPFTDPLQNHRSKAVQCCHVLVLMVYHLYRCESEYDPVSSNYFLFPSYVVLAAVGAVVFGSTAVLVYQVYGRIREKLCSGSDEGKANIF